MSIEMSVYSFKINGEQFPHLNGIMVVVETYDSIGFVVNEELLQQWCVCIVEDFIKGIVDREELILHCIRIRIIDTTGEVIVDTIS